MAAGAPSGRCASSGPIAPTVARGSSPTRPRARLSSLHRRRPRPARRSRLSLPGRGSWEGQRGSQEGILPRLSAADLRSLHPRRPRPAHHRVARAIILPMDPQATSRDPPATSAPSLAEQVWCLGLNSSHVPPASWALLLCAARSLIIRVPSPLCVGGGSFESYWWDSCKAYWWDSCVLVGLLCTGGTRVYWWDLLNTAPSLTRTHFIVPFYWQLYQELHDCSESR